MSLQLCENKDCPGYEECEKARGIWITGPPGLGVNVQLGTSLLTTQLT